jgi:hypothetical protein
MTASPPKVNGHERPAMPVLGDWQPIEATPTQAENTEPPTPEPQLVAAESNIVAQAKAEAIRAEAWAKSEEQRIAADAEAEERRIRAEAEAKAIEIKAGEEARKQKLANDKAEARAKEEQAARDARIADLNRKRAEAERAEKAVIEKAEADKEAEEQAAGEIATADEKWRTYAIRFAFVCGIVSLPVQMSFFWNPRAPWMAAAPVMLEGAAWVVHRGARAAVANRRPVWHYRTIVWLLAFVAAGVNLYHGLHSFDPGTALSTAFASVAGPGVWDLHEHGRIRKRDGALTRRERKAAERIEEAAAAERAADAKRREAEKEAAEKAAAEAAEKLAKDREENFKDVWDHAKKLAADLGETTITEAIWKRAKLDVHGALPGESAEVFRMRNAAEMRVEAARQKKPVSTLSKTTNAQRANQMPRIQRGPARKPPMRRRGDTAPYVSAARTQAAITAKNAAQNPRPNGN